MSADIGLLIFGGVAGILILAGIVALCLPAHVRVELRVSDGGLPEDV